MSSNHVRIGFANPDPAVLDLADALLRGELPEAWRPAIRTVAKALIDEADERNRTRTQILNHVPNVQIHTLSPPAVCALAEQLLTADVGGGAFGWRVWQVALSYVMVAERNQVLHEESTAAMRDAGPIRLLGDPPRG